MSRALFADTFYLLALVNPDDAAHKRATGFRASNAPLVTTDFVIIEVADALCDVPNRPVFARLYDTLHGSEDVEIVPADRKLLEAGIALYGDRPDKDWSLTDCTSFVVMKERGLTDALTGDRHFKQAGFNALLGE